MNETNHIIKNATKSPTKRTPCTELFVRESLSLLREKWFTENKFSIGTPVSDIKYNNSWLKYQKSFYPFSNQLDYAFAHYFAKSKTTKDNANKFLSDPLMTHFTEKLSLKNADKWIEKLLEIPWDIPKDKWIKHKYKIKSDISGIVG